MNGYALVRPALFRLSPERAHRLAIGALERVQGTPIESALDGRYAVDDDRLAVEAFGRRFRNPVGVAAGLDKNARVPNALGALGFGHVEVGAVTARAQAGNPRPRLFRLPADRALINRMGFNNDGADAIGARLDALAPFRVPVGANLGLSSGTEPAGAPADYRYTYDRVAAAVAYVVVNVSSPNTPGLRDLQRREHLERIVSALDGAGSTPVLVKLSPDLRRPAIEGVLEVVRSYDLAGVIAVNTTLERPEGLSDPNRAESGGLSGAPLADRAVETVRFIAERTDRPIVGVGGVEGPEGAYRLVRAGASLVQLYTALVYRGPSLARRINRGLLRLLERDGFDSIEEARGSALG